MLLYFICDNSDKSPYASCNNLESVIAILYLSNRVFFYLNYVWEERCVNKEAMTVAVFLQTLKHGNSDVHL